MAISYRRPHPRRLPTGDEVTALGTRGPVVRLRQMPGEARAGFHVFYPPQMANQAVLRAAPYRYTLVRGHVVKTRQTPLPASRQIEWARRLDAALRARRGNRCEVCELTDHPSDPLQWAHIATTDISGHGRGRKERIRDVRDNPERYALMCRECHGLFDRKIGPVGGETSEHR